MLKQTFLNATGLIGGRLPALATALAGLLTIVPAMVNFLEHFTCFFDRECLGCGWRPWHQNTDIVTAAGDASIG